MITVVKKRIGFLVLLFVGIHYVSKAQPLDVPIMSRPDLFTYFNPAVTNILTGSPTVSKAVIHLNSYDSLVNRDLAAGGTAFLIRTFRDDNKVCMCLTGHQIKSLFRPPASPVAGSSVHFNSDIYMNYLGKDSLSNGVYYNQTIGFVKNFLSTGKLLEYLYYQTAGEGDAALVLLDKRQLPSSYTELGYNFSNTWSGEYYNIGHTLNYPQRISNLTFDSDGNDVVYMRSAAPYAIGDGSSGSPLINRPAHVDDPWAVRGILIGHIAEQSFGKYVYSYEPGFSKISLLESAIRSNCWKKSDSTNISASQMYKQSVQIDNTASQGPYNQSQSFNSALAMSISAAGFTEQPVSNIQSTYLRANVCTIGDFKLPTVYPGNSNPWQVTVAAKQVDVVNGFSYDAFGSSYLHLASVVIGTSTGSTISKPLSIDISGSSDTSKTENFRVYPNPSEDGVFYISFPESAASCRLEVISSDGRRVHSPNSLAGVSPYQLAIPGFSRGTYVLSLYHKKTGKLLFSKQIIYK